VVAVDFSAEARACHVEILVIHPPNVDLRGASGALDPDQLTE
jgi:hypothetical protein